MKPRFWRALSLSSGLLIFAVAMAIPPYWDTFEQHYQPPERSELFKAECITCHTQMAGGEKNLNPYGVDIKAAMHSGRAHDVTVAVLFNLESKDSDHDGFTNIEEIKGGFLPGDSTSHPTPKVGQPDVVKEPTPKEVGQVIPPHSFHPLAVHFPIALFLFGAFLEFFGKWKQNIDARRLGFWNLAVGALASLIAVPTGIAAWLRIGFTLEGNLLIHLVLASAATVVMLGLAVWRRKGAHDSIAYWAILALASVLVAGAGHFGALLVYG